MMRQLDHADAPANRRPSYLETLDQGSEQAAKMSELFAVAER